MLLSAVECRGKANIRLIHTSLSFQWNLFRLWKLTIKKSLTYRKRLPLFEAPLPSEETFGLVMCALSTQCLRFSRTGDCNRNNNLWKRRIKVEIWAGPAFCFINISQKPRKKFLSCILLQLSSFRFRNLNLRLRIPQQLQRFIYSLEIVLRRINLIFHLHFLCGVDITRI